MGTRSVATGKIGEALARNLLLPYFTIAEPVPDQGVDFVAEVEESQGDPFNFAVQVKLAQEFTVTTGTLFKWIDRIGIQPVVLVHVERPHSEAQRYRFRVLHDWMMENPEWERLRHQKEFTFALSEFKRIGTDDAHFRAAITREMDRVRGSSSSVWRAERRPSAPVAVSDLSRAFGLLSVIEPPAGVLSEIAEIKSLASEREQWTYLRNLWAEDDEGRRLALRDSPETAGWVGRILSTPPEVRRSLEVGEFLRFIRAMKLFDKGKQFRLPRYNWQEISCWRVFVQVFPGTIDLLESFIRRNIQQKPSGDLIAPLLLTSTLAKASEGVAGERARKLLDFPRQALDAMAVDTYPQYRILSNFYAARAEAGTQPDADRQMEFTKRHLRDGRDWDLQLMRDYYERDDAHSMAVVQQKLIKPKLRQLNTSDHEQWRYERLKRRGILIPFGA